MSLNWDLLNRADYENFSRVKEMLVLYNAHKRNAARGDTVSHSILVDLSTAIYSGVLTRKQLEVIELYCMHNMKQDAIGAKLGLNKTNISRRIDRAIKAIQNLLNSGKLYTKQQQNADNPYCNIEGDLYSGTAEEVLWDG